MATCKYCGRSGLFFKVSKSGLCDFCTNGIVMEVQSRLKILNELARLIENSKNLDVRLSRCDVIVENAQALMKFENKGIDVISPLPSQYINRYSSEKSEILNAGLAEEIRRAFEKSNLGTSSSAKISPLAKVALRINDFRQKYPSNNNLEMLEKGVKKSIDEIQFQSFLKNAKLAEFKGNKKKALDQYYEALYFLKHDDVDDTLQANEISEFLKTGLKSCQKTSKKSAEITWSKQTSPAIKPGVLLVWYKCYLVSRRRLSIGENALCACNRSSSTI